MYLKKTHSLVLEAVGKMKLMGRKEKLYLFSQILSLYSLIANVSSEALNFIYLLIYFCESLSYNAHLSKEEAKMLHD